METCNLITEIEFNIKNKYDFENLSLTEQKNIVFYELRIYLENIIFKYTGAVQIINYSTTEYENLLSTIRTFFLCYYSHNIDKEVDIGNILLYFLYMASSIQNKNVALDVYEAGHLKFYENVFDENNNWLSFSKNNDQDINESILYIADFFENEFNPNTYTI